MTGRPRPPSRARVAAERHGRRAERLAELTLMMKGFSVVARRFRAAGGEIDLVARRGKLLVFVEVKARANLDEAVFSVDARTRRRIQDAGKRFLAAHQRFSPDAVRYDIIAIAGWRLRHLVDAWREYDR